MKLRDVGKGVRGLSGLYNRATDALSSTWTLLDNLML